VWVSDPLGAGGMLLDLIVRPTTLELRMEIYNASMPPLVLKEYLPLSALSTDGGFSVTMGNVTLTSSSASGSVNGTPFSLAFTLGSRANEFVPALFEKSSLGLLPNFSSSYGNLTLASYGASQLKGTPLVCSRYAVRFDLDQLRWAMISAMAFPGSDLQLELLAMDTIGNLFLPTVYVFYNGEQHQLDDPFLLEARVEKAGDIAGQARVFSAAIETLSLHLHVNCSAPLSQFALLDTEGNTQIHTTVLGVCVVDDLKANRSLMCKSALLEAKLPVGS